MMDPLFVYAAISIGNCISSIINTENNVSNNRKQKSQEYQFRGEIQPQISHDLFMKQFNKKVSGVDFSPGSFFKEVSGTENPPLIVFDTYIKEYNSDNQASSPINPLLSIFEAFKEQNQGSNFTIISHSGNFKSQAEVWAFYNKEFNLRPGIIVYSSFDGTFLRIKALFAGILAHQLVLGGSNEFMHDHQSFIKDIELIKIPYGLFLSRSISENDKLRSKLDRQKSFDEIYKLSELTARLSLQSLIDCYFVCTQSDYDPVIPQMHIDELDKYISKYEDYKEEFDYDGHIKRFTVFLESQGGIVIPKLPSSRKQITEKKPIMNIFDLKKNFNEKLDSLLSSRKKPTILVLGQTGVGKTTLIQTFLGKELVPDDRIGHAAPKTLEFDEYKNEKVTLIDSRGFEPGMSIIEFKKSIIGQVEEFQKERDLTDNIHLIWYCIQGVGARVTETDLKIIKEVFNINRVFIALTKSEFTTQQQEDGIRSVLLEHGISNTSIISVTNQNNDGVKRLFEKSLEALPEAYKEAFISQNRFFIKQKREAANKLIIERSKQAANIGIVPFVDIFFIVPLQIKMVSEICVIYGIDKEKANGLLFGAGGLAVLGSMGANTLFDAVNIVFGAVAGYINARITTGSLGVLVSEYFVEVHEAILNGESLKNIRPLEITREKMKSAAEVFKFKLG